MPSAPLRVLVAIGTGALLVLTGLVAPAAAGPTGTPISPAEGGTVLTWGGGGSFPGTTDALDGKTVTAIAAGGYHDLALTSDGVVTAWGSNFFGESDVPSSLTGKTVTAIAGGRYHSLALTSDGVVTAWGYDEFGQTDVPASLTGKRVIAIAAGDYHSLALTSDGVVIAWGMTEDGQVDVPASLDGKTVTAVVAGAYNSFAITSDGQVTGWGYSPYGASTPPASLDGKTVTALAAGLYQTVALTSDGKVTAWGGDPDSAEGEGIVPASLDEKTVVAVTAGYFYSYALTSDGKVVGWGSNAQGLTTTPAGLDANTVTALSGGESHVTAIVRTVLPGTAPVITGTPQVDSTLTATDGPYNATPDAVTYQWKAAGEDVGADLATYTPGPEDMGKTITVTVTATKAGYAPSSTTSAATGAVAGHLILTGSLSVSGTPYVGETLTSSSTVDATPSATLSGQWLRDGAAIADATATTYTLTNADAGTDVTYEITASRAGYGDASVTSNSRGPVDGGVISSSVPTIVGTPTVGSPLTGSVTGFEPLDATVSLQWSRGTTVVGSGGTYTPTAGDMGHELSLTATFTKDHFGSTSTSVTTTAVASGAFTTNPDAVITGTAMVGRLLTATEGAVVPAPDAYGYRWFADGTELVGAVARTFRPTVAQENKVITVEVTATKAGFGSASDFSEPTGAVANGDAPTVDLRIGKTGIRRGQSTILTWRSTDATSLTAARGWTGPRPSNGSKKVGPRRIGTTTYVLKAVNPAGTTTAQVRMTVRRQAHRLHVAAPNGLRLVGHKITVRSSGLDRGERYKIKVAGKLVATGRATRTGRVVRSVTLPNGTREGRAAVSVTGSERDRSGTDTVRVVRNKSLGMRLAHRRIRASDHQRVTVNGLAAGEHLKVTYQGRRISPRNARANARGTWTRTFDVDIYWGTKTVRAVGQYSGRVAKRTFAVVQRCHGGVWRCP